MEEFQGYGTMERAMMAQAAARRSPINGSMELLPLCNMNCDMCYVRLSRAEMDRQGRMRTGAEWLALGREMAAAGTLFLLLTGGEPLLHPDFGEIYLGLRQMGMILTVNTNATLIDEQWADFFGRNKPRRINITLYGADDAAYEKLCHHPGGFAQVTRAVRLLRERGVDVRLGGSATPANVQDVDRSYAIAAQLDAPMVVDPYMMAATREREKGFDWGSRLSPEEAAAVRVHAVRMEKGEEYFAEYRRQALAAVDQFAPGEEAPCAGSCMAGNCSFAVNWQGLMRPCVITTEPAANVFELGFAESWRRVSEAFGAMRYCAQCSVCRLKPLCPVCAVACRTEAGDYMARPEYLCRYAAQTERLLRRSLEEDAHE